MGTAAGRAAPTHPPFSLHFRVCAPRSNGCMYCCFTPGVHSIGAGLLPLRSRSRHVMHLCREVLDSAGEVANTPASLLAKRLQSLPRDCVTLDRLWPLFASTNPPELAAAFSLLDGRSAGPRAVEVFRLLRTVPPQHPLRALCTTETYAAIVSLVRQLPHSHSTCHLQLHRCTLCALQHAVCVEHRSHKYTCLRCAVLCCIICQ